MESGAGVLRNMLGKALESRYRMFAFTKLIASTTVAGDIPQLIMIFVHVNSICD